MSNSTLSLPGTASASSPVSWQTIFWTLVPLAINSMTQPGGCICGLPSRYRTYLRCSPFLCGADAFSVISQLAFLCLYQKQRFLEAIGLILHERFNTADQAEGQPAVLHDEDDDDSETVQNIEKMTWLRWLWFVLGTLPPAIKLMSMTGVPWEQAWGMMFLTSWIINEGLIICVASNSAFFTISRNGRISWAGFEQMALSSRYRSFRAKVTAVQYFLAIPALILHIVIVNGTFRAVYRKWYFNKYPQSRHSISPNYYYHPLAAYETDDFEDPQFAWPAEGCGGLVFTSPQRPPGSIMPLFVTSVSMIVLGAILFFILQRLGYRRNGALIFPLLNVSLVLISMALNRAFANEGYTPPPSSGSGPSVFIMTTLGFVIVYIFVKFLVSRFNLLGRNLLVTSPGGGESNPKFDHGGFLSLLFFLCTVLGATLWYGYIYNSDGTADPGWTGVFG